MWWQQITLDMIFNGSEILALLVFGVIFYKDISFLKKEMSNHLSTQIRDGLKGLNDRMNDGFNNINKRMDDGFSNINKRIDDLRESKN